MSEECGCYVLCSPHVDSLQDLSSLNLLILLLIGGMYAEFTTISLGNDASLVCETALISQVPLDFVPPVYQ